MTTSEQEKKVVKQTEQHSHEKNEIFFFFKFLVWVTMNCNKLYFLDELLIPITGDPFYISFFGSLFCFLFCLLVSALLYTFSNRKKS